MICPKCRSRATGRIGHNQYYCWDCSIEFVPTGDGVRMYRLEPNGTAMPEASDSVTQAFMTGTRQPQPDIGLQASGTLNESMPDSSIPKA
ncbi:MAG TPA: hypothetical protein GX529_02460 [Firmicutes bacterium]|nr:hypothetical protein [Candidatus Fermentithermobacillaceae bacterium]